MEWPWVMEWGVPFGGLVAGVRTGYLRSPLCWVECGHGGLACMGLIFYLASFFPVKPEVCNAGANCSKPNFM